MQKMPKYAKTAKKLQETTQISPGLPTKMGLTTQKSCNDFLIFLKKTKKCKKKTISKREGHTGETLIFEIGTGLEATI